MYLPKHFELLNPADLARVIREHPLGMLVHQGAGALDADHLPFEYIPDQGALGVLRAHVARANPLWQNNATGSAVMVVFRGVQGYISPSWYPSKHETHRLVPTWNYEVVHVHGRIHIQDDERTVRGVVARLTRHHEATEPRPWKMGDSPADYIDGMLKSIVGIEIEITRLEGKAKLSQNRELRDRIGATDMLRARGQMALGDLMDPTRPDQTRPVQRAPD